MNRRNFLKMVGIGSGIVAAPGIVSSGVLMPVREIAPQFLDIHQTPIFDPQQIVPRHSLWDFVCRVRFEATNSLGITQIYEKTVPTIAKIESYEKLVVDMAENVSVTARGSLNVKSCVTLEDRNGVFPERVHWLDQKYLSDQDEIVVEMA